MTRSRFHRVALTLALLVIGASPWLQAQGGLHIRMGTIVPKGSLWDESLQYVRQEWRKISGGTVRVTIYSGGVLGDETEMVRQIRQGRIQAAALSSAGLSRIDEAVSCLQIPMMFQFVRRARLRTSAARADARAAHRSQRVQSAELG